MQSGEIAERHVVFSLALRQPVELRGRGDLGLERRHRERLKTTLAGGARAALCRPTVVASVEEAITDADAVVFAVWLDAAPAAQACAEVVADASQARANG